MYLNEERARQILEQEGLDAVVVTRPLNLLYVAGFHNGWVDIDAFGIIPRSSQIPTTLLVGHRGLPTLAADQTWVKNIRTFDQKYTGNLIPRPGELSYKLHTTTTAIDAELQRLLREAKHIQTFDVYEALAKTLTELGLDKGRVAFDEMEVGEAAKEQQLPNITSARGFELVRRIRMVKTPDEIVELRTAAKITTTAIEETLSTLGEGADLSQAAITFRTAIARQGGFPAGHGGYVSGSGERSLVSRYPHLLKKGDIMWTSGVASYNAYYSDFVRTYVVGPPTSEQAETHSLLESTFERLDEVKRPGVNSSEVAKSIIQTVKDAGGDIDHLEMNIHTMGVEIVELQHQPWEEGFPLEPNVCFDVFVLYKPGADVFSIERNYVVNQDGSWEELDTLSPGLLQVN